MPVVSCSSVSDEPPMVVVACYPRSFTCELASKARAFSLCILGLDHLKAVERLAEKSGRKTADKLADAGLHHKPGKKVTAPVIDEAEATVECEVSSKERVGDHVLIFGLVKAAYSAGNFSDFWDFTRYKPILYTGWRGGLTVYPDS